MSPTTETRTLIVYVPVGPSAGVIRPGSAVVGVGPDSTGRILVDYEGDIYRSEPAAFADRADRAAGRHVERYPTVARMWLLQDELVEVGEYNIETGTVGIDPDEQGRFAAWLGSDPEGQLATTSGKAARRREADTYFAQNPQPAPVERMLRRQMRVD